MFEVLKNKSFITNSMWKNKIQVVMLNLELNLICKEFLFEIVIFRISISNSGYMDDFYFFNE